MVIRRIRRGWRAVAFAALAAGSLLGCVERRYTIRTNPPGALAFINGEEVGSTPVSKSFTYYGDREIILQADGFQTQRVLQPIKAPWWDNAFTDFFSENLLPFTLRDEREYTYQLSPASNPMAGDLVGRAQSLRDQGKTIPPPRPTGILGWLGFP